MDIPIALINFYLSQVTVGFFNHHDLPPAALSGYGRQVTVLESLALKNQEDDVLRLGFEHILGNPAFDCTPVSGGRYPYTSDQIREIIGFVWQTLWPDAGPVPPGGPPDVRLVPMPLEAWRATRKAGS